MVHLERYVKEGKKFDYVFGDLTDIPISDTPTGEIWNFIRTILETSFKILKPGGKYLTHGNGSNCVESLKMFEEQLDKLEPKVYYTKTTAFVPSFMEDWVFYQVNVAEVWPCYVQPMVNSSWRYINRYRYNAVIQTILHKLINIIATNHYGREFNPSLHMQLFILW